MRFNKLILLLEKILRITINTIVFFFMARSYAAGEFGFYNYVISLFLIMSAFSTLGFESYLVKLFVERKMNAQKVVAVAVMSRMALLFVASASMFLFLDHEKVDVFIFFSILMFPFYASDVFDYYNQSKNKFVTVAAIRIIVILLLGAVKLYAIQQGYRISTILLMYFVEFLLYYIVFVFIYKYTEINSKIIDFRLDVFTEMLRRTWPLIPSSLALILYLKSDIVMLNWMLGEEYVAEYASATKVVEAFYFIAQITLTVSIPTLINIKNNCAEEYKVKTRELLKELLIYALISVIVVMVLADAISSYILDNKFPNFVEILYIYSPVIFLVYFRSFLTRYFHLEEMIKCSLLFHVSTAILNIIFNYILISYIGIQGAAFATLLSYTLSFVIVFLYYKELRVNFMAILK